MRTDHEPDNIHN